MFTVNIFGELIYFSILSSVVGNRLSGASGFQHEDSKEGLWR